MPQLDIIYIFYIYMWTWLTMILISQKMGLYTLAMKPKKLHSMKNKLNTLTFSWT